MTEAETWRRRAGHCTHLRKPEGLSETLPTLRRRSRRSVGKVSRAWVVCESGTWLPFYSAAASISRPVSNVYHSHRGDKSTKPLPQPSQVPQWEGLTSSQE